MYAMYVRNSLLKEVFTAAYKNRPYLYTAAIGSDDPSIWLASYNNISPRKLVFNFTSMHLTVHFSLSYPSTPLFFHDFLFTFVGRGCQYWFYAWVVCNGDCAGLGLIQPQLSAVLCEQPSLWSTCFFQQHQSMLRDVPMKALPHWLTHGFEELQSCVAASSPISALLICVMQRAASDRAEVLLQFIYN